MGRRKNQKTLNNYRKTWKLKKNKEKNVFRSVVSSEMKANLDTIIFKTKFFISFLNVTNIKDMSNIFHPLFCDYQQSKKRKKIKDKEQYQKESLEKKENLNRN